MNKYDFDGTYEAKQPKGRKSKAAKQAYQDMREDEDMKRTIVEIDGHIYKTNAILTEDILIQDE